VQFYNRSFLTAQQAQVYDFLLCSMGQPRIPCIGQPTDVNAAIKALLMDHPQICYFEGKWQLDNGMILPLYVLHPAAAADVQAAADRICHTFPHEDYPKQVYLWMLNCIRYDPAAPNSQNAYGALVQHSAVCKGIAKAYQLLMRLRQIPCILVEGTLDGVMKHVWNMVYLDGLWLHVDVTMGYPQFWSFTGASDIFGGYLRTTEEITRSHRIYHIEKLPVNTDGGENNGIETM
jgi:hypothetical protein